MKDPIKFLIEHAGIELSQASDGRFWITYADGEYSGSVSEEEFPEELLPYLRR
jgi:hypothetical protein